MEITDSEFFIPERRKRRRQRQAIDPGDDRGATTVPVVGRARGDDLTAPGRRRQTTRGEHAAAVRRCQYSHSAGDTRLRDEVSIAIEAPVVPRQSREIRSIDDT